MGWWSATIMGGDSPCDQRCVFEDIVMKVNKLKHNGFDDQVEFTPAHVNKAATKLLAQAKKDNDDSYDQGIAGQVLGVFMMENGATISASTKAFIIESARMDEWAQEEAERKRYINKFIKQVQTYKAKKPKHVPYESLGQKLVEAISTKTKKKGLINKNL